jgi:hypothetical protein
MQRLFFHLQCLVIASALLECSVAKSRLYSSIPATPELSRALVKGCPLSVQTYP